jgi:hypothetical protein
MCCDSDTFLALCDLHPHSAQILQKDAEEKNNRLLEYRQSKEHLLLDDEQTTFSFVDKVNLSSEVGKRKNQNVLVRTLLRLKALKQLDDQKLQIELLMESLKHIFTHSTYQERSNPVFYQDFKACAIRIKND